MARGPLARSLLLAGALCIVATVACQSTTRDPAATSTPNSGADLPPTATAVAQRQTPGPTRELPPSPTATPEPVETPLAIRQDLRELETELTAALEEFWLDGNYAYAVTDLQTGETVSVRGDVAQMSGCVMNFFVILRATLDVQEGRYDLDRVDSLIRATTWSSNAVTARDLYTIVGDGDTTAGVQRVGELIESLGLADILIDHPPSYHAYSLGIDYNNWVTVEDTNRALAALWNGDILDDEYRAYVLEVMADVKPGLGYLTASVPEGVVSHKNGFFYGDTGYVDNDIGIVRLQRDGQEYAYAASFLAEEVPSLYAEIPLGQQLGSLTYEVMAARYPAADSASAATTDD